MAVAKIGAIAILTLTRLSPQGAHRDARYIYFKWGEKKKKGEGEKTQNPNWLPRFVGKFQKILDGEIKAACSPDQSQQPLRPQLWTKAGSPHGNSLQSVEEENELTQKLPPYRTLPKGSTLEHVGFFTIWNVSIGSDYLFQKPPQTWEGTCLILALFSRL